MASQNRDNNYYRALMGGGGPVPIVIGSQILPQRRKKFDHPSESESEPPPRYQDRNYSSDKPLTSWSSAFIADKPQPVQERVVKLFSLQHSYTALMMQYQEEALALERKYQALVQPLYEERAETITGLRDHCSTPDGIPDFWLQAMKNEPSIAELIAPRDEHVLSELRDVKLDSLPSGERGFVLVFSFSENTYFYNDTLRKTYTYTRAADTDDSVEDIYSSEYTYHESIGDTIHWKDGNNLIEEREEDEDGDQQESFFTFFSPPMKPEADEDGEESEEMRTYEWLRELDFDYGEVFKEKVIPYAVHWYTGEAALYEDVDDDDSDDSEEDEEDEGHDEDEDDEHSEGGHRR